MIVIALYGAICNFRTDSRFQVTNEYLLVNKLNIKFFNDFGILDLRTTEPFRSYSRTFFLTYEPSD